MNTNEYINDLDRLLNDPSDTVCMTKTAFKSLLRNIHILNKSLVDMERELGSIRYQISTNQLLSKEMEDIITSLSPKKKLKFGTKENLIPDIKFRSSAEKYEETINSSPKTPLSPVPDYNEVMNKIASKL